MLLKGGGAHCVWLLGDARLQRADGFLHQCHGVITRCCCSGCILGVERVNACHVANVCLEQTGDAQPRLRPAHELGLRFGVKGLQRLLKSGHGQRKRCVGGGHVACKDLHLPQQPVGERQVHAREILHGRPGGCRGEGGGLFEQRDGAACVGRGLLRRGRGGLKVARIHTNICRVYIDITQIMQLRAVHVGIACEHKRVDIRLVAIRA